TIGRADQLDWIPGLGMRTAIDDWPDMAQFLATGGPKVLQGSRQRSRQILTEWTKRLNLGQEIQSLLVIPLRASDHVVGLIDLGELRNWERAAFTPEKLDLATAIAAQTASLIDRMRLTQHSKRREQRLANLDKASRHIRVLREPTQLQQEIVRQAVE